MEIRWSQKSDRDAILELARGTEFFRDDEIVIAAEVLDDALDKGPDGHYQSYTATLNGRPIGWGCFGPTPCTLGTYDIYWLAVEKQQQGKGVGKALVGLCEKLIRQRGGRLSVIETSGREIYNSSRQFYLKMGYPETARLKDFYAPGDDKVVYVKRL